jgi:acyl-CoA synthetase (AMP-forming)/AMP-acid ligase II
LSIDRIDNRCAENWSERAISSDCPALIQYTSGSTGSPRGVVVTHANLIHNSRVLQQVWGTTDSSVLVSWLPLFHDLGLIGNIIHTLFFGATCILMSPTSFVRRPVRWLHAISKYRATISGCPNFGYELCCRKVSSEDASHLDLRCWSIAYSGAEPVRIKTLRRFEEKFAPCGLGPNAFLPGYGLAEATLVVSAHQRGTPLRTIQLSTDSLEKRYAVAFAGGRGRIRTYVSCGVTHCGDEIAIVDDLSRGRLPENSVGEIWVRGASVAKSYWNDAQGTEATFGAFLADGSGPFLRTGDLGLLNQGDLFVIGRLKDLILIRGRNYFPEDIELTVEEAHPALRPGYCAAFSIDDQDEERLVVVQEVRRDAESEAICAAIPAIRDRVSQEHHILANTVVLIEQGALPKTTSGKIARSECKRRYIEGNLQVVRKDTVNGPLDDRVGTEGAAGAGLNGIESHLRDFLAAEIGGPAAVLDLDTPLTTSGIDSVLAEGLLSHISTIYSVGIPAGALADGCSIHDLATLILSSRSPKVAGFSGFAPGIFEEALATLESNRPLYLLGGFGGATHVLTRAILLGLSEPPPELTTAWHEKAATAYAALLESLKEFRLPEKARDPRIAFDQLWQKLLAARSAPATTLNTGLNDDETRELMATLDPQNAVRLVLQGFTQKRGLQALPG